MKITLEVSSRNEGTAEPWWMIISPRQMLRLDVHEVAGMITGPFFSRSEAEEELKTRPYAYSKHAHVYCASGCYTKEYRAAYRAAERKLKEGTNETT